MKERKKSQKKLGPKLHKSDTGITRDVGQYIEGYDMCQQIKNRTEIPVGKLKLNEILEKYIDILNSRFYYKITISSWERYNPSGL